MTPEQRLAELKDEALKLRTKNQDAWTDADSVRALEVGKEINSFETLILNRHNATIALKAFNAPTQDSQDDNPGASDSSPPSRLSRRSQEDALRVRWR